MGFGSTHAPPRQQTSFAYKQAGALFAAPTPTREKKSGLIKGYFSWAYIQRRDFIMAWSVILSVYGADPIAEFKLFSILHFTYNQL